MDVHNPRPRALGEHDGTSTNLVGVEYHWGTTDR